MTNNKDLLIALNASVTIDIADTDECAINTRMHICMFILDRYRILKIKHFNYTFECDGNWEMKTETPCIVVLNSRSVNNTTSYQLHSCCLRAYTICTFVCLCALNIQAARSLIERRKITKKNIFVDPERHTEIMIYNKRHSKVRTTQTSSTSSQCQPVSFLFLSFLISPNHFIKNL